MNLFLGATHAKNKHDACLLIQSFLEKQKDTFQHTLIPDLSYLHENAACTTGINIDAVEHRKGATYTLRYSYQWFIYNGCVGLDEHGSSDASVDFTLDDKGMVVFDLSILGLEVSEVGF